jgi:MHS family proline/betaine transporter-like MFS transporter
MDETAVEAMPISARLTKTVAAGAIGNVLEWYDFGLFGFFAPVISQLFFPSHDELASLVGTYGVYATGFLMRPLGGVVFGYIGDRMGRKRALELSVLLMAVPTTLMALLPTYAQAGVGASLLLTLFRLLQGLSVGGEYIGSMSFLSEHAPPGRRAFLGSFSSSSVILGSLLGSGVAALLTGLLTEADLLAWGWRLPFLGGIVIGLVGLWLRSGVDESPSFLEAREKGGLADNPIKSAMRHNLGPIAVTLGLTGISAVGFYLPFVWLPTWLARINQPPLDQSKALTASTIALVALLILTPLTALLADRVGKKPMFLASAIGYAVLTYPLFLLLKTGTYSAAVLAGLVFAACNSLYSGCMAATMVELFPTRTRYSGVAIGYNTGQAILGGTAPLIATGLIELSGNKLLPAVYLIICSVMAGIASLFITEQRGQALN